MAKRLDLFLRLTAQDRASGVIATTQSRLTKFGTFVKRNLVASLAGGALGVAGLVKGLQSLVRASIDAEQQQAKLSTALKATGDASAFTINRLNAQADAIQNVAGVSNDAVTATQAFLKNLGVSTSQIEQATQASVDLASALGISLESAARNVGRTVGGFAGELGELVPELKDISREALLAGEGITFLAEKFSGQAAANAKTLQVQLQRLTAEIDDLKKAFIAGAGGTDEAAESISNLADAANAAEPEARALGASLRAIISDAALTPIQGAQALFARLGERLFEVSKAALLAERGAATVGDAFEESATQVDRFQIAVNRADAAQRAFNSEAEAFGADLKAAGVTVKDTASEIDRLNDLLVRAGEGFRSAATSEEADKYARAIEAINSKLAELRGETEKSAVALALQNEGLESGATNAIQFSGAIARAALAQRDFNNVVASGPAGSAAFTALTGLTARDQRNQGIVNARGVSVVLGGTRVNLQGGGSRLLVSPSGTRG